MRIHERFHKRCIVCIPSPSTIGHKLSYGYYPSSALLQNWRSHSIAWDDLYCPNWYPWNYSPDQRNRKEVGLTIDCFLPEKELSYRHVITFDIYRAIAIIIDSHSILWITWIRRGDNIEQPTNINNKMPLLCRFIWQKWDLCGELTMALKEIRRFRFITIRGLRSRIVLFRSFRKRNGETCFNFTADMDLNIDTQWHLSRTFWITKKKTNDLVQGSFCLS